MTKIPLRLGPLQADGYTIHRSGVRWLCEPGQMCAANQAIAYFNLSLERCGGPVPGAPEPFAEERELQVVCAPRVAGRVTYDSASTPGGYLSILSVNHWDPEAVLAQLEVDPEVSSGEDPGRLRLLMLAGRRMTPLVDVHSGLLPGWNGRSRGWWTERGETPVTLLSLGICDVTGVIMGERCAFLEMFAAEPMASQFVFIPDHPIAPAAPVLLDQLQRTPAEFRAILSDFHSAFSKSGNAPTADDWMFAGTMLSVLERCPIRDGYDLLSDSGLTKGKPADAVLLSLYTEPPALLRHKTLGYHLHVLRHHQTAAGPAMRNWLATALEPVPRNVADIKADYEKLIDAIERATGAHVLVLNRMSTTGDEDISTYAPFDAPLSATLASVAAKEINLMLHDVAAERNVSIIDIDAIAADIGGGEHLPDGIHQSKAMQDLLRQEILHAIGNLRPKAEVVKSLQTRPA
jgi:hypothetical protein